MKMHIETDYPTRTKKIFLWEEGHRFDIYYSLKDGQLVAREISIDSCQPLGEPLDPFLVLPYQVADSFIRLIVENCTRQGIHTEKESKLEGRLEATRAHLADMQDIVKHLMNKP